MASTQFRNRVRRFLGAAIVALVASPAFAQVSGFSFALVNPVQIGGAGTPVVFTGVFNNSTANNIYLNALSFDVAPGSSNTSFANNANFILDDTLFFDNQAANLNANATTGTFFLTPGQTATFNIFSLTALPNTPAPSFYDAQVTVRGGTSTGDAELDAVIATLNLQPVPAPPSWMSLPVGAGIAGLMGVVRRRRTRGSAIPSAAV